MSDEVRFGTQAVDDIRTSDWPKTVLSDAILSGGQKKARQRVRSIHKTES
jgi:hypothetical protein